MPRLATNYSLCVVCQAIKKEEDLVENPSAHEKLLSNIYEKAKYGDTSSRNFPEIGRRLENTSAVMMISSGASWHRSCYQDTSHRVKIGRARKIYEESIAQRTSSTVTEPSTEPSTSFTRSKSVPFDKTVCFFCDSGATRRNTLHKVAKDTAGINLNKAIAKNSDAKLRRKLSTAIDPTDAHAVDVHYHAKCWVTNVTNVLGIPDKKEKQVPVVSEIATEIEFISLLKESLQSGQILSVSKLHDIYENIQEANGMANTGICRKKLKQLITTEIPEVEFHKSARVNESDRISIKSIRDSVWHMARILG
jgi:hypothetical protein